MPRLVRRGRNPRKYQEIMQNLVLISTKVVGIEEKNKEYPDSKKGYKNVFYCESTKSEKPTMCIYWGYSTLEVGDVVSLKGRIIDNNIFLCREIQILRKGG